MILKIPLDPPFTKGEAKVIILSQSLVHTPIYLSLLHGLFYKGVCNTPLRSSPQCYRSCVGMLTIIYIDTHAG